MTDFSDLPATLSPRQALDLSPAADQKRPYARRRPQRCAQGLLARLVPLNRYEQHALVRLLFAIKEFDRIDRNERRWAKNNVVLRNEPNW